MGLAIGIDSGGTWARVALGNKRLTILKKCFRYVDTRSNDHFLKQLVEMVFQCCENDLSAVEGIGVAMAGRINMAEGTVVHSPHTSLKDIFIRKEFEDKLKKPLTLLNDNLAAAIAEWTIGSGVGHRNLVYVGIGTGIGGGVIADGKPLIGKHGNAHEIGHMIIDMDERIGCTCGGRGHWEAYTSGSGMPLYAKLLADRYQGETPFLHKVRTGQIEAKEIFEAAKCHDRFADFIIDECARLNAMAFANITNFYDPSLIAVGGGVAVKNADLVVGKAAARLAEYSFNAPPQVTATSLGEDAPLIGAMRSVYMPLVQ
jgi:glucokinase